MPPHWLEDLARRAQLENADTLHIDASMAGADAWLAVAAHCGISVDELAQEAADRLHLPLARLDRRDPHVVRLVPEKFARRFHVVPLRETNRQIVVATDDPLNDEIERGLAFAAGRMPLFEIAPPAAIEAELARMFAPIASVETQVAAPADEPGEATATPAGGAQDAETLRLVTLVATNQPAPPGGEEPVLVLARRVLTQAVHAGASEIHFEFVHGGGTVRQRVDGIMHVQIRLPLGPFGRVLTCIKSMAGLPAGARGRSRNGRIALEVDGNAVELLLAIVPFHDAEKCVVRLPDQGAHRALGCQDLAERDLRVVRAMIDPGHGIVLVAGPVGSGRTTTLYALMARLQADQRRIHTIEDPIEVRLEAVEQIQVDPAQGVTFAEAFSRALRADPDVIMVGDLHEPASARLAVQAGMTGHLVIAGMLADDAAMAIGRLGDMGVERPAVAAAVRGAIAQRLMRRVCTACAEKVATPNAAEQRLVRLYGVTPVVRAHGCPECGETGYRGRVAIHEVLTLTPALRELVARGASAVELRTAAVEAGMRALRAAALQRVLEGVTTLQEVERVVSGEPKSEAPAPGVPRVLLVDDEPVCRMAARRQLEANGFEVAECATGEEALVRLRVDDHIALVVLDLGLPGLQGDDVLRELRLSPATAGLPVVVLTGSPDPDLEERIIEQGADDYLHKPLEPRRFITRIRAALRRAAA